VSAHDPLEAARPFYGPEPCASCRRWPGERHASSCRQAPGAPVAGSVEPRPGQTWAFDPPAGLERYRSWDELAPRPWRMRLVSIGASSGRYGRARLRLLGADGKAVPLPDAWSDERDALAAKYGEAATGAGVVETHAALVDLRAQRCGWRRLGPAASRRRAPAAAADGRTRVEDEPPIAS